MKVAVAGFLLAVLFIVALVAVGLLLRAAARRWRVSHAQWEIAEEPDHNAVRVIAFRLGTEPLLIESVPFGAEDFDSRLYEARARGRAKIYALNESR